MKKTTLTPSIFHSLVLILILAAPGAARAEAPAWATYTATFDATWSAETHPQSFPGSAHWSGLIGGTHDDQAAFWTPGELASTGIKQMAEWGSQPALAGEVEAQITAGHAGVVIQGGGISVSPGQVSVSFTIGPDHPLVTIVSMIAPSPDWFAGARGVSLLDGDIWLDEVVVDLYPYDAGTDSGTSYGSGDVVTSPPVPIAAITGAPFSPGVPVGTLTFRRDAVAAAGVPAAPLSLQAVPNPFNPATELRFTLPDGARRVALAVHDARGRLVRRLAVDAEGGLQRVNWDGRSDAGQAAPSGVYFARLDVDGVVSVRKLALVQ